MKSQWVWRVVLMVCVIWAGQGLGWAQQAPDTVLYNGKIVTVDDPSYTSRLGTIAQAMHVRDGKILHVGTNAQIRAMAGPNTKLMDLKGRTVIPGLILTHEHPYDWNLVEPWPLKKVLGNDDKVIVRFLEGSPEENIQAFPRALEEAVLKARPGQWIYIVFTFGENYEWAPGGNIGMGRGGMDPRVFNIMTEKRITKQMLDMAAPNNPVLLRDVFTSMIFNQKGLEESRKVFPEEDVNSIKDEDGLGGANQMRWAFADVVMKDFYPELVEIIRLGHEWWAGYGMTSYSSNAYNPGTHRVYGDLDRRGQMPVRVAWTWNWRAGHYYPDEYFLYDMANRLGQGTDYYWNVGGRNGAGGRCTTLVPIKDVPVVEGVMGSLTDCVYDPGNRAAQFLYDWIKAGNRYAGAHHGADKDVDNVMDIIERASKDAGLTEEQIRAKRHTVDHSGLFPRPDQVDRLKRLNMALDGNAFEIYQASPAVFETFGERALGWVVPKKRLNEAGIINTFEMDRALGTTNITLFEGLSWFMTRKAWDGKVYSPDQAIDRQTVLKVATIRGAEFVLREDLLGSLESGKWADFLVLDRDYLTVPEEDIENIRVLMTVLGGKTIHLAPSLAREIGMPPAGAQVTLGGPAAQW